MADLKTMNIHQTHEYSTVEWMMVAKEVQISYW